MGWGKPDAAVLVLVSVSIPGYVKVILTRQLLLDADMLRNCLTCFSFIGWVCLVGWLVGSSIVLQGQ